MKKYIMKKQTYEVYKIIECMFATDFHIYEKCI
jgi:hypothetical protein